MAETRNPRPILIELCILFAALWIDAFVPGTSGSAIGAGETSGVFSPAWLFAAAARNASKAALVLLVMHKNGGLAHFGFAPGKKTPTAGDFAWSTAIAGAAIAVAIAAGLVAGALGAVNPMFANSGSKAPGLSFICAAALSSLAVGYAEELFFRVFAQDSLERAGLGRIASAVAISLVFGAAHSAQGLAGMASATIIGGIFSAFRLSGRRSHQLALGHALYDFVVLMVAAGMQ